MDIAEFLAARLAEDEQVARTASGRDHGTWDVRPHTGPPAAVWSTDAPGSHIARHDPARVLAEVAAKRAILDMHRGGRWAAVCETCADTSPDLAAGDSGGAPWPCDTLRVLACVYADHPDFDPSWRVET